MEYVNIHVSVIDSAEFKSAEPVDQATWFKLLRFCCGQENGGVIEKAAALGDRQWQALACVTLEEVNKVTGLWKFVADDLEVNFYPEGEEKRVKSMRRGGKIGNARRWGKKKTPESLPDKPGDSLPVSEMKCNEMKCNETPPVRGGVEGHLPESVSDDVVLDFGKNWTGEPASGTPPMAVAWVTDFLKRINGRREWPRNWQRFMVSCWRSEWRTFGEAARPGFNPEKNGAKNSGEVSASVRAIQDGNRRKEIQTRMRELNEEIEALHGSGAPIDPCLTREEIDLRRELATMGGEQ